MLRALVFDFDGLIVDTESPAYEAWQELYRRHGQELPIELWAQVIGTHEIRFDAMAHLELLHGQSLDKDALQAHRGLQKAALTDAQPLLPGVRELVEYAREAGVALGVASSSHHPWVEGHLGQRGILEAFNTRYKTTGITYQADNQPTPTTMLGAAVDVSILPIIGLILAIQAIVRSKKMIGGIVAIAFRFH